MGKKTSSSSSTAKPPEYIQQAQQQVINAAGNLANQPLQQYGGALQAGYTPAQLAAFKTINNSQGIQNPYINTAAQYTQQATNSIANQTPMLSDASSLGLANSAANTYENTLPAIGQQMYGAGQVGASQINGYMNPFQQQVINATLGQINNQNQQQQNQLQGNAVAAGAFGGDRLGVAQGVLGGQQALATNQTLAGLNSQNYSQALGAAQQQAGLNLSALNNQGNLALGSAQGAQNAYGQQLSAAEQAASQQGLLNLYAGQQYAGLGQQAQNAALTGANAQLGIGNQQQQQNQQQLNIPYQQFLQQQAYPYQQLSYLSSILGGTAGSAGGTTTQTQPAGSLLNQIGGVALAALPYLNRGGGIPMGFASGGSTDTVVLRPHTDDPNIPVPMLPAYSPPAHALSTASVSNYTPPNPSHAPRYTTPSIFNFQPVSNQKLPTSGMGGKGGLPTALLGGMGMSGFRRGGEIPGYDAGGPTGIGGINDELPVGLSLGSYIPTVQIPHGSGLGAPRIAAQHAPSSGMPHIGDLVGAVPSDTGAMGAPTAAAPTPANGESPSFWDKLATDPRLALTAAGLTMAGSTGNFGQAISEGGLEGLNVLGQQRKAKQEAAQQQFDNSLKSKDIDLRVKSLDSEIDRHNQDFAEKQYEYEHPSAYQQGELENQKGEQALRSRMLGIEGLNAQTNAQGTLQYIGTDNNGNAVMMNNRTGKTVTGPAIHAKPTNNAFTARYEAAQSIYPNDPQKAYSAAMGKIPMDPAAVSRWAADKAHGDLDSQIRMGQGPANGQDAQAYLQQQQNYYLGLAGSKPTAGGGLGAPVATDSKGKPVYNRNGKYVYADGTEYQPPKP